MQRDHEGNIKLTQPEGHALDKPHEQPIQADKALDLYHLANEMIETYQQIGALGTVKTLEALVEQLEPLVRPEDDTAETMGYFHFARHAIRRRRAPATNLQVDRHEIHRRRQGTVEWPSD